MAEGNQPATEHLLCSPAVCHTPPDWGEERQQQAAATVNLFSDAVYHTADMAEQRSGPAAANNLYSNAIICPTPAMELTVEEDFRIHQLIIMKENMLYNVHEYLNKLPRCIYTVLSARNRQG
jgi:hypothetical protein